MRNWPGFLNHLQRQIESIDLDTLNRVNRFGGLQVADLLEEVLRPKDHSAYSPYSVDRSFVKSCQDLDSAIEGVGLAALERGEVAFCVLAGGAGTRIGGTKGLLRIPGPNVTLLGMKVMQSSRVSDFWVMTSPSNDEEVRLHFNTLTRPNAKFFQQYESLCLTPDNQLFLEDGKPVLRPCGHGDLIPALKNSGLLQDFLAKGGKYVYVVNVDNVLGGPDPHVLGQHIQGHKPVTCEVVKRHHDDTGGLLCGHEGADQIVEQFRLTRHADVDSFPYLSTNSYVFNADLDFDTLVPSWHRIKKVVDNKVIVQYERLLQDLTATFQTQYIEVLRETRFHPVKTQQDLLDAARLFGE